MSSTLLNRTTATKENALTDEERDAFLTELRIGRLATMREDGWPHVTPIWYVWDGDRFVLTLGKSRRHLRNIARDPQGDAVRGRGPADDRPDEVAAGGRVLRARDAARGRGDRPRDRTTKVEERYLPAEARGPELDELLWFEGRVGVVIEPERWLAWDQGKG